MRTAITPPSRLLRPLATLGTLALVGGGVTAVGLTSEPFSEQIEDAVPALSVEVRPVEEVRGYDLERAYLGRVEARRESDVGFELGGELLEVLVDEGERVPAGAPLARLDTQVLEAERATLEATLEEARSALELAEITRTRVQEALTLDAVARQTFDDADKERDVARARLRRAESAVRAIETRIARALLVAPFDALVAARHVDEGQVLAAGTPVLRLLERGRPEVRIGVAGSHVDALEVGSRHTVRVRERELPARVRAVLPLRGDRTRAVDVLLELDAELGEVRSGDLATLRVTRREETTGAWLPLTALTASSRGLWAAYVVEPRADAPAADRSTHTVARRELEVLHTQGERVFVRGTVADGELVVTRGVQRLVPDLGVQIVPGRDLALAHGDRR